MHCVNTIQSGSTFYTSLFNPGTVDEASYFRFTCFVCDCRFLRNVSKVISSILVFEMFVYLVFQAFTVSSTGIRVSDSKGSCQMNQSPTNKATDGSGTIVFTQNRKFILDIHWTISFSVIQKKVLVLEIMKRKEFNSNMSCISLKTIHIFLFFPCRKLL